MSFLVSYLALAVITTQAVVAGAMQSDQPGPASASDFRGHMDALVPRLLRHTGVPGAAVALVQNGEVVYVAGYGFAHRSSRRPVTGRTQFNVGSIAKPLTAWGVLRLAEQGAIDLDLPVSTYLERWTPEAGDGVSEVTVRRLLSHTAGISLPSVPDSPWDVEYPPIHEALADPDHPVELIATPGEAFAYSGGGYMILQLMIEEVSGSTFSDFMQTEILEPLGMHDSYFGLSLDNVRAGRVASPYDGGEPTARLRWPGLAAADLYTTAEDLGRFVAASSFGPRSLAHAPVGAAMLRAAQSAAPATTRPYGMRYGYGHDVWPLAGGRTSVGHNGQNTGWAAAVWWIPGTGDGVVVLTNDSEGMSVHRWVACDWLAWADIPGWGGYCSGRNTQPAGTLVFVPTAAGSDRTDSLLNAILVAELADPSAPGASVVMRRGGREIGRAERGRARLDDRESRLTVDTPIYLASVAKPITASAVSLLVDRGLLAIDQDVAPLFPEIETFPSTSVRDLIQHTAGIPSYWDWISWPALRALSNADVLDSLAAHPWAREHDPSFGYSNSHYVLLAEIISRTSKRSFAEFLESEIFSVAKLPSFQVDDGDLPAPEMTADGYAPEGEGFRLSNYEKFDLPGPLPIVGVQFATTGAGGLYGSAADLARWGEAVLDARLPGLPGTEAAPISVPPGELQHEVGHSTGFVDGWFVSTLGGHRVLWHDGNRAGFRSIIVLVPAFDLSMAITVNRSDWNQIVFAERVLEAWLPPVP